jgi:hypothetical protein
MSTDPISSAVKISDVASEVLSQAEQHRNRMAERSRQNYAEVSDIGEIPPVKNPERREACREDLHRFLITYFPHTTGLSPFSTEHKRAISRIQMCTLTGGLFSNSFPRGFAKTTISENSVIWAVIYGHRKFAAIFGASGDAADALIESIKLELGENDLLYEDFPEVCHAIRALEGKVQRCASQTYLGARTHIEWTADKIALPTIKGSPSSGGVITTRGMTAALRGMKHKVATGEQLRPDLVIIDDPQTDESARSDLQTNKRIDVIRKSILKLGSHGKKIAVVMNATVIQPGDLVDQISDPKKFPAWQSERIKMVQRWPDAHEKLWLEDYAKLRNTFDPMLLGDQQRSHKKATRFYKKNRKAMDAGGIVTWDHCFDRSTEISAIQHAYNLLIDDGPEVFASECQNEPLTPEHDDSGLTSDILLMKERFNNLPMGKVPLQVTRMVAHIDVQGNVLFWMVVGFDEQFGGTVIDFGTWPHVERGYFTIRDIRKSLRAATGASDDASAVKIAVQRCIAELKDRMFMRVDGSRQVLEKIGVDANWGKYTDEVYSACRESEYAGDVYPTHGRYFGAKSLKRFEDIKPTPADRIGPGWRLVRNVGKTKRGISYLNIDTNRWKTAVEKRINATPGASGSLMLNGKMVAGRVPERHRMLADHILSEKAIAVEAQGRTAIEWIMKKEGMDNHLWDNLVSCFAIGSVIGVRESTAAPVTAPKKVKFSEIQRQRREKSRH